MVGKTTDVLAGALARLVHEDEGLHAIYLPNLPGGMADAIVRKANALVPLDSDGEPFAIVVSDTRAINEDTIACRVVRVGTAIAYRQGSRLAVVEGRNSVPASFTQTFVKVPVAHDYPGAAGTRGDRLSELAACALDELLEPFPALAKFLDRETARKRLASVFEVLASSYERLAQGTDAWNVYWFTHVAAGLTNLRAVLGASTDSDSNADEVLASASFAAFALPRPTDGITYSKTRKLDETLKQYWADTETVLHSLEQLKRHPSRPTEDLEQPHSLSALPFDQYQQRVAAVDNLLLAWSSITPDAQSLVKAFQDLHETQFFTPDQGLTGVLEVTAEGGASLSGGRNDDPQIVIFDFDRYEGAIVSEELVLRVPIAGADETEASGTNPLLQVSGKGTWDGTVTIEDGYLVARGRISVPCPKKVGMAARPVTVTVTVASDDVLASYVGHVISGPLYPVVADGVGVWTFEKTGKRYKAGVHRGYDTVAEAIKDDGHQIDVETQPGAACRVVLWGADAGVAGLSVVDARPDQAGTTVVVTQGDLVVTGDNQAEAGNLKIRWVAGDEAGEFLSPLLAAAMKGAVSSAEPDQSLRESFRARVEHFLATNADGEEVNSSHGHMVIFEDSSETPDYMVATADGAVLVPRGSEGRVGEYLGFTVSDELRSSPEAQRFRSALKALGLESRLSLVDSADTPEGRLWPSRASWAHLHDSAELGEYLDAYTELVTAASAMAPSDRFWATFPFSVAVYASSGSSEARAVLLTPLHPLRLAWLASAEAALRGASGSFKLAGLLESWNLPLVGPQANSMNGRVLAIPTDAGPGQLFVGWSMMTSVSVTGPNSLATPGRIGALAAPGTSATGLNADAVQTALKTYQKMNPQVATLTLDLSSSVKAARLAEIDEAVVKSIVSNDSSSSVRGGVRVYDSLNRQGDPPLDEVERRVTSDPRRPVRWSRYSGEPGSAPRSNIRFLQDAGLKVAVSTSSQPSGTGLVSAVPLRRLTVPATVTGFGNSAIAHPAVEVGDQATSFVKALGAVEGAETGFELTVELFKAALVNETADWTVTGESLLGATALADMLAVEQPNQMLWEWRPPYLTRSDQPRLDARPFVSVVRVPPAFQDQISTHVKKILGGAPQKTALDAVREVMATLGARGIGLSTLMAQGGTHAAGAIGFYLTLRLMELVQVPDCEMLVLPIDACDEFLRALANEDASANQLRRADLLVLAVRKGRVTMLPVEIKSYGLEAASPSTALLSSASAFEEPLKQLESTTALLKQLLCVHGSQKELSSVEASLWRHGFAAMLEAGMRLRPDPAQGNEMLTSVLESVLSGTVEIDLARPLACLFQHGASTAAGEPHELHRSLSLPDTEASAEAGALVANTASSFKAALAGSGAIVADWANLVSWALDAPVQVDGRSRGLQSREQGVPSSRGADVVSVPGGTRRVGEVDEHAPVTGTPASKTPDVSGPEGESAQVAPVAPAPAVVGVQGHGVRFPIGRTLDGFKPQDVDYWPSNTALKQMNVGVVGDLGSGKTQYLKGLIRQLRLGASAVQNDPITMLVFDYKRDFQDEAFLQDVGGKVLTPFHIPLDVLALQGKYTPQKAVQAAGSFLDVLSKIYGGIGPVQRNNLLVCIKELFVGGDGQAPTIGEIFAAYTEANGMDAVGSILNGFVLNEIFSEDRDELVTMKELLADRVLVLAVNDLGADDKMKRALITLFLNQYYEYMLRLPKRPYVEGEVQLRTLNSYVVVDEATNIMQFEFPVLEQLLLQGREFGVGVVLASQYVSHFKAGKTDYGETLLTKVIHQIPSITPKELHAFGVPTATQATADRIVKLSIHEALCQTLGADARFIRGVPYYELVQQGD